MMSKIKPVIDWEPKATNKRDKSGVQLPTDFHGVFRTRVDKDAPGALHYSGVVDDKPWSYYAKEATVITGYIRWVDKVLPSYTGATTKIALFIESERALHKVMIDYDASSLREVMNAVCGMETGIPTHFVNLSYWVRKKEDGKGNPEMTPKGKFRLLRTLIFRDVTPAYEWEAWREFSDKEGLRWEQKKDATGKTVWNTDAELKFWDKKLVGVQRWLLQSGTALPFTYGSLTCCEAENPSGGGNLKKEEIEAAKERYEEIKGLYRFAYQNRETVDADSVLDDYVPPTSSEDDNPEDDGTFPANDLTSHSEEMATPGAPPYGEDSGGDDMPF